MSKNNFPPDFLFAAATASYQVEGAWNEDGKGESIWDHFAHTPGKIANGDTGDVACDHYHRWRDDIALMREIGLNAYRFSVSWPRILPAGRGQVNQRGLDFYAQLVDGLLEAGIRPFPTLFHWDLPQALQEEGGWTARSTADAFAGYADVVTRALGDRVEDWMTLNEPGVVAFDGYLWGTHAPGHSDMGEFLRAAHYQMLGHGLAIPVMRRNCPTARLGIALNLWPAVPASCGPADIAAAQLEDDRQIAWFLGPLTGRGYPGTVVNDLVLPLDFIQPGEMETIAAPLDFVGANYYSRSVVRSNEIPEEENAPQEVYASLPRTAMGWEIYPQGLYDLLVRLQRVYGFECIYVTENGAAFEDSISPDGEVHDLQRVEYYRQHLGAAARAIADGVPLKGFFTWSLMDNFEWAQGYSKRFGMLYVDYPTQRRILKDSGKFYRDVIRGEVQV